MKAQATGASLWRHIHLRTIAAIFTLLVGFNAYASLWEFAGVAEAEKAKQLKVFFDSETITRPTKDSVRFWVKNLDAGELERYGDAHDKSIVEKAWQKMATGYVPRLFLLSAIHSQFPTTNELNLAIANAIADEIIVNEAAATLHTLNTFYVEIDCAGSRLRLLQGTEYNEKGKLIGRQTRANEFGFIAPDSNAQWWSMMFCPPSR
jgi:hypothetical protein